MSYSLPFHGEFASADASALTEANSRFTLYEMGLTTALTLAAGDYVVVTDIIVDYTGATTRTITLYDGADNVVDAGEKINELTRIQNDHTESQYVTPFTCQKGTFPKVKTSGGGQVTVLIRGQIERAL